MDNNVGADNQSIATNGNGNNIAMGNGHIIVNNNICKGCNKDEIIKEQMAIINKQQDTINRLLDLVAKSK